MILSDLAFHFLNTRIIIIIQFLFQSGQMYKDSSAWLVKLKVQITKGISDMKLFNQKEIGNKQLGFSPINYHKHCRKDSIFFKNLITYL